ncbi:MAG: DUF3127 domain-containing protein [Xanthomonadales bacterium]|nr:DUF3127 domain-containing protein [Xanthomonadales bacterium]
MELTGKIIQVLPEQSGTSQRGPWRKQEYIIEVPGDYPKQVCFMAWGDKIDEFGIQEGQELTVHFDLQSREYNGRWYTDVKAWRVQAASDDGPGDAADAGPPPELRDEPPPEFDDDVPF